MRKKKEKIEETKQIQQIRVEPRGLGDLIEKITFVTGVSKVVKKVSKTIGLDDCGCNGRKDKLNEMFPFKNNIDKTI